MGYSNLKVENKLEKKTIMKKHNLLFLTLIMSLLFVSCGDDASAESSNKKKAAKKNFGKIAYTDFKISNQDKKYFKLVDGGESELIINDDGYLEVTCEFEVVNTFTGKAKYNQVFVSIVSKDEKNKTVEMSPVVNGEMRTDDSDGSQFLDFMMGEPGSTGTFIFTGCVMKEGFEVNRAETEKATLQIKSFKVLTDR